MQALDTLSQDLKYGFRQLRLKPGFTAAAVLSLALGIGANTAIFTLLDQILLRLLPVENPRELVQLRVDGGRVGSQSGDGIHTFAYPTYLALRDRNTVFTGLTGQRVETASLSGDDRSETIPVGMVAGNFFQVMGVRAAAGRLLTPADDVQLNGHPVAVLQYDFWQSRFQGRQELIGQPIRINGLPFTVVGVAGPGFEGTDTGFPTRVWVPVAMRPTITPTTPNLDDERNSWFYPFARLKPGVSIGQAEAAMKVLFRQRQEEELNHSLFSQFPQLRERFLRQSFRLEPAEKGASALRRLLERPLWILQGLVGVVLLIACSNVAGLLLARGSARHRELAIRGAIGAGRGRLALQLLSESALLAVAGGAGGLALGWALTRFLVSTLPVDPGRLSLSTSPDMRVLLFAAAATAATTVIFGLLPAWQASGASPASTMRAESGSIAGGRHVTLRKFFVGLQVGLSAMLLIAAGLFIRTLSNLHNVDLGLKSDHVVMFTVRPAAPYEAARKARVYRELMDGLARTPGVRAVGANRSTLFTGGRSDGSVSIPGLPESKEPDSFFNWVTPGYFDALGIPVKAGRDFSWRDWGSGRKLALVNERVVKEYFGGLPPVGKSMGFGMRAPHDTEIVGVFGDARYHDVRGEIPRQVFTNLDSVMDRVSSITVYARAAGDPRAVMPALRQAVAAADSNLVINDMRTLDDQLNLRLANERLTSSLSGGFALLATILALVGLHGVLAFVVERRTQEIGIRIALGATRRRIVGMVSGEMGVFIAAGLVAGSAAGYFLGAAVESQLFGVRAADPLVIGVALAALLAAAAVATLIPAWRACRIQPVRALRYE